MTLSKSPSSSSDKVMLNIQFFPFADPSTTTPRHHRSFMFAPVEKDLSDETSLWIGRKIDRKDHVKPTTGEERASNNVSTDRECMIGGLVGHGQQVPGSPISSPAQLPMDAASESEHNLYLAFRSKVVSRLHAKIWIDQDGQAYLKDTGSSSGTFLNRLRLSPTGKESPQYALKSGDVIQFGVDYQGRHEEIYKAVTVKIFLSFKTGKRSRLASQRLKNAIRNLLSSMNPHSDENDLSSTTTDCCICLHSMQPYQALFLAPCSHCFHYKCCTPLLGSGYMFQCPLCRQVANLEASVTIDDEEVEEYETEQSNGPEKALSLNSDESHLAQSPPVVDGATTLARGLMVRQPPINASVERTSSNEGSLSNIDDVPEDEPADQQMTLSPESSESMLASSSSAQEMGVQLHRIVDALTLKDRQKLGQALDEYERIMKDLFAQLPEDTGLTDDIAMVQARLTNAFSLVQLNDEDHPM